jgi:hypothetical protein
VGWEITEWAVAIAAFVTACGVIWQKVVKPTRRAIAEVRRWMHDVQDSVDWTRSQMERNGGTSLRDRVDRNDRRTDALTRWVVDSLQLMAPKLGVKLPDPPNQEDEAA